MDSLILVAQAAILILLCQHVSGRAGVVFAVASLVLLCVRAVRKAERREVR